MLPDLVSFPGLTPQLFSHCCSHSSKKTMADWNRAGTSGLMNSRSTSAVGYRRALCRKTGRETGTFHHVLRDVGCVFLIEITWTQLLQPGI